MNSLNALILRRLALTIALIFWIAGCSDHTETITLIPCSFTLSPSSAFYADFGGPGSVTLSTLDNCSWTARSDADWLLVTGKSNGRGSVTLTYRVAENPIAAARMASIEVVDANDQSEDVHFKVSQAASTRLPFRGAYTFVMEVDPDGSCGWPVTTFYWLVFIEITSFVQDTARGSIVFPQTPVSPSSMWSISSSLTKTELVPSQDGPGPAGGEYNLVVEGGNWEAGGFVHTHDGREQITDGTASGVTQILTLRNSDKRWDCQSDVRWSLLIRYGDED